MTMKKFIMALALLASASSAALAADRVYYDYYAGHAPGDSAYFEDAGHGVGAVSQR